MAVIGALVSHHSHHSLEAFAGCPESGRDALRKRFGKAGPMRAGNAFHAWAKAYLEHLLRERRATDFIAADAIWGRMRGLISPEDERHIDGVPMKCAESMSFQFLLDATDVRIEVPTFLTIDHREVPIERLGEITAPLFRVTPDLEWRSATADLGTIKGEWTPDPDGLPILQILDWKTNWLIEHVDHPANNRQLMRYAAARMRATDTMVVVWLAFPRRGVIEGAVFFREELERAWVDLVVNPIVALEGGAMEGERVVGPQCLDCGIRNGCDAALRFPYVATAVETLTPDELVVAVGVGRAVLEQLEGRLRAAVDAGGPVAAGKHEAVVDEVRTARWTRAYVKEQLAARGLSPEQIEVAFSVTEAGIRKALSGAQVKGIGKALKEIKDGAIVDVGTKMRVAMRKDERVKEDAEAGVVDYE